jgi:hypothetical protein
MEIVKIVAVAVFAAIAYGITHDQATAHLCVEYFTIAHPPVFATLSPFWLAVGWGIIATWWLGLALGVLLALAARFGARTKFGLAELLPSIVLLAAVTAASAASIGLAGYTIAGQGVIALPPELTGALAADHQAACMAAWMAHGTSYAVALLGGLFIVGLAWYRRGLAPRAPLAKREKKHGGVG